MNSMWGLMLIAVLPLCTGQCLTPSDNVDQPPRLQAHRNLRRSELEFATDLLRAVTRQQLTQDQNLLFSPTSVFRALLLAYFMSANRTEQSLRQTMHLAGKQNKFDNFGAYTLENYFQKLRSIKEKSYQLNNVNRLYVSKTVEVRRCMKTLFGEEMYTVNCKQNHVRVWKKINQWVADQTRNVIKDFLSEDQVTKETQLVLVNAAYFKGKWEHEFPKEDTSQRKFYLSNGTTVKTLMMTQQNEFKTNVDKKLGAEVVELPYKGGDVSMYVLLPLEPSPSAVTDLVKKLTPQSLQNMVRILNANAPSNRPVVLPQFTIEHSLQLTPILESMGVGDLFRESADLTTLSLKPVAGFSEAVHKAKIRVDEEGTEAAAATGFIMPRVYVETFLADHPFVYTLYDKNADVVLFFGVYNSPPPAPTTPTT